MLFKGMNGKERVRELISVLSTTCSRGPKSSPTVARMRDRAAVNNVHVHVAMQTFKLVYPCIVNIGCFSPTINHVGENFHTLLLLLYQIG